MYASVHSRGTSVNVDCVRHPGDVARVIDGRTTGQILDGLRTRAGLTVRQLAEEAGYAHGSGVQRYIAAEYDGELPNKAAAKLLKALEGKGDPPINRAEIVALTGIQHPFEVEPSPILPPRYMDLPRDVPVYGTALGTFTENEVIEQTLVTRDDPIDFLIRPVGVANRTGIYGLYITGESQSPRFEPGEIVFVDPKRAPGIGDDVIVYLRMPEGDGEAVSAILIKKLVRRGPTRIELRQLNPFAEFSVDMSRVQAIHRVLTNADLWAGYR